MTVVANRLLPALLSCLFALVAPVLFATGPVTPISAEPLAPHSGPRKATLFTVLNPADTGVISENRYADPKMWTDHYQELAYGAIGTGVAVGDYDNDGRPDLFVVSKTEPCRLFRNLGNWKFEDVTERAGLVIPARSLDQGIAWVKRQLGHDASAITDDVENWKQGATFVDVNNDGWLDLYICRFGAPNLLYINQGDGTFKEEAAARGLAITDASVMAVFGDYDRDGWLDVYLLTSMLDATAHPNGQHDRLLRNNGDGTFSDVTLKAGITGEACGHSATWWDFDGDGWPDLYVANDYAAPDRLYRNNHDGTFTDTIDRVVPHTPYYSMGADFGDVNNDGRLDFFVGDMAASSHEKDQRGMAGSRARAQLNPPNGATAPQYMRNALYLNTGTGRFLEAATLAGVAATDWTWSTRFEDLDNDGRVDLHITNGMIREYHNADLLERIMAAESSADSRRLVRGSPVLAEANFAFRNLGDLHFENVSASWGLDQRGVSFGAAFADFDGDGDLDLVFGNFERGVTLLRNDSDTGHRLIVALRGTRSNRFGIGAIVRIETASGMQVRQLALARGYCSSSDLVVHFGLGNDDHIRRLIVEWPSGITQSFTNLSANQKLTITEPPPADQPVSKPTPAPGVPQFTEAPRTIALATTPREAPASPTRQQPLLPLLQHHRGPALAVGDLDQDQRDDLVVGGTAANSLQLLRATAEARLAPFPSAASTPSPTADDGPLLIFDADGDGLNDLLVTKALAGEPASENAYQPQLYLNSGGGTFRPAPASSWPELSINAGAAVAADFNRDGRIDVFIGARSLPGKYPLPGHSALLVNRGGTFVDATDELAPGLRDVGVVTSALWTDVDGDGWLDLVLAIEWGGIRYWHNNEGKGFVDQSAAIGFSSAGTGWWTSLASADFNGDGRPDYVVGNLGLNTRYHATVDQPALLFYGDFGSGAPLAIEGHIDDGRLLPWLTRNELRSHLPSIAKRFPRNDAYARATLPEILGPERLSAAQRFAITELRSGVLLSRPDGAYRFEPLPRIAQIAPLQGIVAGDFDGDGHADIFAVQNCFAPLPAVGRFDGGLGQLLRGDGHGRFSAVEPAESGLVVPGDAKALVTLDFDGDGWPDFIVSRNRDTMLAFRNQGVAQRRSLRVSLRGSPGNPTALGARITVESPDGTTQMAEISAGSGYSSQSSPACFFGYSENTPPARIRVRWPLGESTVHELSAPLPAAIILSTAPPAIITAERPSASIRD